MDHSSFFVFPDSSPEPFNDPVMSPCGNFVILSQTISILVRYV